MLKMLAVVGFAVLAFVAVPSLSFAYMCPCYTNSGNCQPWPPGFCAKEQ